MNVWFSKTKALYFAEEIISLLSDIVTEVKKNSEKNFNESEVRSLSNEFLALINTKVSELKNDPNYQDPDFISYFRLAMVAIVDDTFLTQEWSGRQYWTSYLLELRLFSSRISGDTFFENCRKILQLSDTKSKELAAIYHLCLVSGFKGRFFHTQYAEELSTFRTDLYNMFNLAATETKNYADPAILPSGYIENKSKILLNKKYKFFNQLLLANIIIIIAFVITSYFVWFHSANLVFRNL